MTNWEQRVFGPVVTPQQFSTLAGPALSLANDLIWRCIAIDTTGRYGEWNNGRVDRRGC